MEELTSIKWILVSISISLWFIAFKRK